MKQLAWFENLTCTGFHYISKGPLLDNVASWKLENSNFLHGMHHVYEIEQNISDFYLYNPLSALFVTLWQLWSCPQDVPIHQKNLVLQKTVFHPGCEEVDAVSLNIIVHTWRSEALLCQLWARHRRTECSKYH